MGKKPVCAQEAYYLQRETDVKVKLFTIVIGPIRQVTDSINIFEKGSMTY